MNNTEKLAKELLIARVNAYAVTHMAQNPRLYAGAHVIAEWHKECLSVAEAIEKATEVKPSEGAGLL